MFGFNKKETEEERLIRENEAANKKQVIKTRKKENVAWRKKFDASLEGVGERFGQFGRVGMQPPSFSKEQEAMQQIMGGGRWAGSCWGNNNPVNINHDLNPRQRGDFGTASLFGF